ncbi:MAG TPA: thiol oxidoreductase, partial [Roseovarius nubinhibens]|nr:thiol oxidoreductase [Roseovarius nubinhibens]
MLILFAALPAATVAQNTAEPFAWAKVQDDPHLSVVPRSASEAARIAKVLTTPDDFTAPQPFEELSGG